MPGVPAKRGFKFCAGAIRTKACACFKPIRVIAISGAWFSSSKARKKRQRVWNSVHAPFQRVVTVLSSSEKWIGFEGAVEDDQKFWRRRREGEFWWFACGAEALIKVGENGLVTRGH